MSEYVTINVHFSNGMYRWNSIYLGEGVFAQVLDSSLIQVIEKLFFETEELPNKLKISKFASAESGT